ncbi:MAG: ribbon-helix-helix protein, CopG family [Pseudomonadales bacterium]|jgi:hypothetical protein|nr:ribbon-helix-helix protein, CopG family [Pseudomonadales bacterium]
MTTDIRINARLTDSDAARFQELLEHYGISASDLLREALREYHISHLGPQRDPLQLLQGYVGGSEGAEDLSTNYKQYLSAALEEKNQPSQSRS